MSYIRNILLSSAANFAPEDEGKSAVQLQRESIKVTNVNEGEGDDDKEVKTKGEGDDEKEEIVEGEEIEKENAEGEEGEEELNKEDDKEEETELQAKERKKQERVEKKLAKESQRRRDAEARVKELEAKLVADGKEGNLTEADVEKLAETKAEAKATERAFVNACNKLATEATKIDKDFIEKINTIGKDIAPIPPVMIGILEDLENGAAILNHLANNEDEYEDTYQLSPAKMAVTLAKLSEKLKPKPKIKSISKVPDPTTPINGNTRSPNVLHDKMSTEEWVQQRNREVAEKQKAGRYNLR